MVLFAMELKLRSSREESNWPLRSTCAKTAAPTWYSEAIWTLLLFWHTVARSGQLDSALDERSFSFFRIEADQERRKGLQGRPFAATVHKIIPSKGSEKFSIYAKFKCCNRHNTTLKKCKKYEIRFTGNKT